MFLLYSKNTICSLIFLFFSPFTIIFLSSSFLSHAYNNSAHEFHHLQNSSLPSLVDRSLWLVVTCLIIHKYAVYRFDREAQDKISNGNKTQQGASIVYNRIFFSFFFFLNDSQYKKQQSYSTDIGRFPS